MRKMIIAFAGTPSIGRLCGRLAAMVPPGIMGLEPGASIGPNLRLVRLIAKGGMGSVWVAEHPRLKTQVAVKLISDLLNLDPIAQKRFALEAEAAAKIRSPHVVQILDHGTHA